MVRVHTMTRSDMRDRLRRTLVPLLVSTVGETYAKAVDICLSGRLSEGK